MRHRIRSADTRDAARLGDLIRQARERLDLSQEELGDSLGLTDTQVSRLENGRNTTDAERLAKAARLLHLDAVELLRLSGYTTLAEELVRREDPAWVARHRQEAASVSAREIQTIQGVLDRLKRFGSPRAR